MSLTPSQCRAGRALLNWTQADLAGRAGVAINTVKFFEMGKRTPQRANREILRETMEAAGVDFIDRDNGGPGARLRA
jgi:transcriptional regulator with XRE-family HTH domain